MKKLYVLLFAAVASFLHTQPLSGNLIITVGNGDDQATPIEVLQGEDVTILVSATTTLLTNLSGYNLMVDFGGDGFGIPGTGDFTLFGSNPVVGGFDGAMLFDNTEAGFWDGLAPGTVSYDFIVSQTGAEVQYSAGATVDLFEFTFQVSADAAPGIYDIVIPENGIEAYNQQNANAPGDVPFIFNNGSIVVVAVVIPEPGSLSLVMLGGVGLLLRRRR